MVTLLVVIVFCYKIYVTKLGLSNVKKVDKYCENREKYLSQFKNRSNRKRAQVYHKPKGIFKQVHICIKGKTMLQKLS